MGISDPVRTKGNRKLDPGKLKKRARKTENDRKRVESI